MNPGDKVCCIGTFEPNPEHVKILGNYPCPQKTKNYTVKATHIFGEDLYIVLEEFPGWDEDKNFWWQADSFIPINPFNGDDGMRANKDSEPMGNAGFVPQTA
jgi:hypothetical protein